MQWCGIVDGRPRGWGGRAIGGDGWRCGWAPRRDHGVAATRASVRGHPFAGASSQWGKCRPQDIDEQVPLICGGHCGPVISEEHDNVHNRPQWDRREERRAQYNEDDRGQEIRRGRRNEEAAYGE